MLAYIYPFIYTSCMFTLVLAYKDRVLSCERSSIGQFPRYLSDFFFLLSNSQITKVQRDSFRWNILIRLIDLYQNIRLNPGKLLSVIRHKRLAINGTLSKYDAIRFSWSNAYSHQSLNTFCLVKHSVNLSPSKRPYDCCQLEIWHKQLSISKNLLELYVKVSRLVFFH